jgi:hypothetical protein
MTVLEPDVGRAEKAPGLGMDGQVSGTHLVRKRSRTKETARLLNSKLLSGRGGEGQASDYEEKADDAQEQRSTGCLS